MKYVLFCLLAMFTVTHPYTQTTTPAGMQLLEKIKTELGKQKGMFALAFTDLQTKEQIVWNGAETFHAASTMKTPGMIELFKQVAAGKYSVADKITVKNEFKSIVDSSVFNLNPADDSQQELYKQVGTKISLYDLVYEMIIMSSNLATNIIMEMVDGKKVTQTMRDLGAKDIVVLRGVEDQKAYDRGLSNTTTAYDLMLIFNRMAEGKIINQHICNEMIKILLDQKHNTLIPAFLPKEVKVAHKTGTITGVHHDSGIVFLPDGRKYTLVILSKKLEEEPVATVAMARVSEMIYQYVAGK
jgi:beta-lactamase class A